MTKYDKVTQELRLASPSNDTFEWLVGPYYTKEKGDIIQHIDAVAPGTLDCCRPAAGGCDLAFGVRGKGGFPQRHGHFSDSST